MNTRLALIFIFALAVALRAPAWFTKDGKSKYTLFEPDEYQHVEVAIHQIQTLEEGLLADKDVYRFIFNARGFGIQLGVLSYGLHQLHLMELTESNLVVSGRILATIYSLLLILLCYHIARKLSGEKNIGLLAGFLIAIFDLNITGSHYAIPSLAYIFWTYASVYWIYLFVFKQSSGPILTTALPALGAALAFALKYDFIPILVMGSALLWHIIKDVKVFGRSVLRMLSFLILMAASFKLVTFFNFSITEIKLSFLDLYRQNKDVVAGDSPWLYNPILYFFAILGGTSFLVITTFWPTFFKTIRSKANPAWKEGILFFSWFLFLELLVRWTIDTPFIRRVNIFLPFIAIVTAKGLYDFHQKIQLSKTIRMAVPSLVIIYTLILSIISQSNFWFDTRYKTSDYIKENHPEATIRYSPYIWMPDMKKGVKKLEQADLFIMHETYYGRYWRYFTTPFKIPQCCEEVYHCESEEVCLFYQNVLSGKENNLKLIKSYETVEIFPERVLFKYLFGTYETFLGDVKIYKVLNE